MSTNLLNDERCETALKDLQPILARLLKDRQLPKYIHYARFPNFKNLELNSKIDFSFPLTVVTGPNGTGKSTILHALYGMPKGYSTEKFWFSTRLDAIEEGGKNIGPHRFVYGHQLGDRIVESRKARVTKGARSKDYWEPTKAVTSDGMEVPPPIVKKVFGRTKDRWDAVEREVLFLNFKSELSAYDKYMYFGRERNLITLKTKQDLIRRDSGLLKKIVENNEATYTYHGRAVASEVRLLTPDELASVQFILGREYLEAKVVQHRLFGGDGSRDGLSVIFKRKNLEYSEAHAGSGEVAIVSAVTQILSTPKNTLILLDEPEVSLHPSAQRRFLKFLMDQIVHRRHQVVLSTHSSEFVRGLPKEAVKLMSDTGGGRFQIIEDVTPSLAFAALGTPVTDKLTIYVEDEVAKIVVVEALGRLTKPEQGLVEVRVSPGGAPAILGHAIPVWMQQDNNILVLLDGDQRKADMPDPDSIPKNEEAKLESHISASCGCWPNLPLGGTKSNANANRKVDLCRAYMRWFRKNVRFLPRNSPEEIIINAQNAMKGLPETEKLTSQQAKEQLLTITGFTIDYVSQSLQYTTVAQVLLKQANSHCKDLDQIAKLIKALIANI